MNRQICVQLLPLFARISTTKYFTRFILVVRSSVVPTDPGSRLPPLQEGALGMEMEALPLLLLVPSPPPAVLNEHH